ncbi:methyl-accepting chemotaxis protein [Clostridium tetanomorphum]|uniref:Methyl-accepting chemotaxis protein n=4 Tax=Clostridium tetanomorphum TaxID=1553 RepID=A0A923J1X7_CLOTT|nr:methyl-accepting chemotaxis protein [Clostridium tetanomorphum]MBC2397853.1 methyl-accepting chemotaxis protein [Clostridium tetanomorphum]NRS84010.1 methyl-accepting chemotaxis protein [Clostridium tetanomorphum]
MKTKIILPMLSIIIIFIATVGIQINSLNMNLIKVKKMNEKAFKTLSKSEELKLNVVQVQQWLTDISATRGAKGFDDGFDEAEKYAQYIKSNFKELISINPEYKDEVERMEAAFTPYYDIGKKMAKAYIEGGPNKGNIMMEEFDGKAEAINKQVDDFKSNSYKYIETSIKEIEKSIFNTVVLLVISIGVGVIVLIIALRYILKGVIKPINNVLIKLKDMSNNEGDLTQYIDVNSNDEIGELAKNINEVQDSFRNIIATIIDESSNVENIVNTTNENINMLTSQIENTSAATEEIASGMDEAAVATEEMNGKAIEIENAINLIAEKAHNGANIVEEISKRAENLKQNAKNSQNATNEIRINMEKELRMAIEKSKAVDQINLLTESIFQITSQTNLLALNAAIEASRAGESGKGFAVVADEIRKLAENSKHTISQIKEVTEGVIESVNNLSRSSEKVLEFIDENVIKDYETLIHTGDQYYKDADFMDNFVSDLKDTLEKITYTVHDITKSINEVSIWSNEAANGTENIANITTEVVERANNVVKLIGSVKEGTKKLSQMVCKFKV